MLRQRSWRTTHIRDEGKQEYSIKIGGTWYSYRRIDPLGSIIGMAADLTLIAKYGLHSEDELAKLGTMISSVVSNNLFDKLSMRGVTNFVQAAVDWPRYGPSFINQLVGGLIPLGGAVGQIARMEDPLMRDARSFTDFLAIAVPSKLQIPFTDIGVQMPFPGRESGVSKRDRWGEPRLEQELGPIQTERLQMILLTRRCRG